MDFSKLIDKKLVWAGTFSDDNEYKNNYVLFDDGSLMIIPDPESGEDTQILEDGRGTLNQIVHEGFKDAVALIKLASLIEHPLFKEEFPEEEQEAVPELTAKLWAEARNYIENLPSPTLEKRPVLKLRDEIRAYFAARAEAAQVSYPITETIEAIPVLGQEYPGDE